MKSHCPKTQTPGLQATPRRETNAGSPETLCIKKEEKGEGRKEKEEAKERAAEGKSDCVGPQDLWVRV